jgi:hypothetical protein
MNDYTVTLTYDYFSIITVVYADTEEEAKFLALQKMTQDEGLPLGDPIDWQVTLAGSFAR